MKNPNRYPPNRYPKVSMTGKFLLPGALLALGVGTVNAQSISSYSSLSSPGLSSSNVSNLSKDFSVETNYWENRIDVGMGQGFAGKSSISKVARAYLDYTFLSRRTESFSQNLQGRFGVTDMTLLTDEEGMSEFRSGPSQGLTRSPWDSSSVDSFADGEMQGISGHRSFLASLQWRLNAPGFADKPAFKNLTWGEVLQISFFADYGKTFSRSGISTESHDLAGFGTGLKFSLPGSFTANLQAAYSVDSWSPNGMMTNGIEEPGSNQAQYWFDFSYRF